MDIEDSPVRVGKRVRLFYFFRSLFFVPSARGVFRLYRLASEGYIVRGQRVSFSTRFRGPRVLVSVFSRVRSRRFVKAIGCSLLRRPLPIFPIRNPSV